MPEKNLKENLEGKIGLWNLIKMGARMDVKEIPPFFVSYFTLRRLGRDLERLEKEFGYKFRAGADVDLFGESKEKRLEAEGCVAEDIYPEFIYWRKPK